MEQTRRTRQAYYYWLATSTCPDPGCAREGRRSRTGGNQPALPSDLCTLTHLETWSSAGLWISGVYVQILPLNPVTLFATWWELDDRRLICRLTTFNEKEKGDVASLSDAGGVDDNDVDENDVKGVKKRF